MPADALAVVDEVTAAVEDQATAIDLDRPGVVGGMTVDDVHPTVYEAVSEPHLLGRNGIPPVGAPVTDTTATSPARFTEPNRAMT